MAVITLLFFIPFLRQIAAGWIRDSVDRILKRQPHIFDVPAPGDDRHLRVFVRRLFYTPQCLRLYLPVVEFHDNATAVTVTAVAKIVISSESTK